MHGATGRRTAMNAAIAALCVIFPGPAIAQEVRGTVTFENGTVIPKGLVEIYLSDPARQDNAQHGTDSLTVKSNGKSTALNFILPSPVRPPASSTLQVVARLERTDGWLLARGSSKLRPGEPANITLNKALY